MLTPKRMVEDSTQPETGSVPNGAPLPPVYLLHCATHTGIGPEHTSTTTGDLG